MTTLLSIRLWPIDFSLVVILIIFGIPTFFICSWLIKKIITQGRKRQIITWVSTLISTPLLFMGTYYLLIFIFFYYPTRKFDKDRWISNKEKRYQLSEDIIESKMLIGKTETEVERLLGPKENTYKVDYWQYYIGWFPGPSIDPALLLIHFKDGKVVKVTLGDG